MATAQAAMGKPPKKVVIDAGVVIRLQRLEQMAAGAEFYSTSGVLGEIRDAAARQHILTLPVDIKPKEPTEKDIAFVKRFATQTGDIGFLSPNDINLIALTYMLQRETGDVSKLRVKPLSMQFDTQKIAFAWGPSGPQDATSPSRPHTAPSPAPATAAADCGASTSAGSAGSPRAPAPAPATPAQQGPSAAEASAAPAATPAAAAVPQAAEANAQQQQAAAAAPGGSEGESEGEGEEADEFSEDDSDCGEWVTSDNIHRFGVGVTSSDAIKVACVSTDYSVQNVCMQMGLHVLTVDGFQIRQVKLWGLTCRACFTFTRDTTKMFCPKCGNATVDRVPITVDGNGEVHVHDNRRKRNLRGTVYSIPKTQMGRHANNLVLCEDQMMMGGRDRMMRHEMREFEKERAARDPFNEDVAYEQRGWWTRKQTGNGRPPKGAPRVQVGYGRANPNANGFQKRKSKK